MARKNTRAAQGSGTIRKKTVTRGDKAYTYWEARITTGRDPGTGKQIQRSITGKTQKEVREKLQAAAVAINDGTYTAPSKMTVADWLDIWQRDYLGHVKPGTAFVYAQQIRLYIKPAIGAAKLESLDTHTIQHLYNGLSGLSPKSIKDIHGVLHKALQQAVEIGYIKFNPSNACKLPRVVKKDLAPLDEDQSKAFLHAIQGHRHETLYTVALFTGMREGELLGLLWDCVDFKAGTITIKRQLKREQKKGGQYYLTTPKNDKPRTITPAPWVIQQLRAHWTAQVEKRLQLGACWRDQGLVFPNDTGGFLSYRTVYDCFKRIVASIGRPDARFHDLRHSYAVAAIRSGDDIKTVQGNLGHATAAFTLDVYGHVTEQMKQDSANRMEGYIKGVLNL
jgi:integrase